MRRAAHEALTKRTLQSYRPIQTKEATILVSSLLASSGSLRPDKHFQRFSASTIMSIVYDYPTIVSDHDHTIESIEQYSTRVSTAAVPGSNLVDIFPWMMHIPERSWTFGFSRLWCILTHNEQGSRNGSEMVSDNLMKTMRCLEAFSIASETTLYVLSYPKHLRPN